LYIRERHQESKLKKSQDAALFIISKTCIIAKRASVVQWMHAHVYTDLKIFFNLLCFNIYSFNHLPPLFFLGCMRKIGQTWGDGINNINEYKNIGGLSIQLVRLLSGILCVYTYAELWQGSLSRVNRLLITRVSLKINGIMWLIVYDQQPINSALICFWIVWYKSQFFFWPVLFWML